VFDYLDYLKKLADGHPVDNPFLDFMGMELEKIENGYARFSMLIRPEFIQGAGIMQGGLGIAFSSETVAQAVMTTLETGNNITTLELKNNFISPAVSGRLTAEATVFKKGSRIIIADCIVRDEQGRDISRSTSTLMVLKKNP
jgi:acyl-CoA thioesterase